MKNRLRLLLKLSVFCCFSSLCGATSFANNNNATETTTTDNISAALFEGDIITECISDLTNCPNDDGSDSGGNAAAAVRSRKAMWPSGIVPYEFQKRLSATLRKAVEQAMQSFHEQTCVRFVPRTTQPTSAVLQIKYQHMTCAATIGVQSGGRMILGVDNACFKGAHGIIKHELMHVLGFFHEQARSDRDQYVKILFKNVVPGMEKQFQAYVPSKINDLDLPYDYGSIMHYDAKAFSRNGLDTIVPLKPLPFGVERIGQRKDFSTLDLQKIRKLYNCTDSFFSGGEEKDSQTNAATSSSQQKMKVNIDIARVRRHDEARALCNSSTDYYISNIKLCYFLENEAKNV